MAINQLHHVNYLVNDLEESLKYFTAIFQQMPKLDSLDKRGVKTARFDLGGVEFILVQPLSKEGIVAQTLAEKGEGVFLISFGVDDLSEATDELQSLNIAIDSGSFREGLDGWQVCDLAANNDSRTTLQLCEDNTKK